MSSVLIVQAQMKQYRVPFFENLYRRLQPEGVGLKVAYSTPPASELAKGDTVGLPEDYGVRIKGRWVWNERILFQPLWRQAMASDLVIVEHANKHFLNHLLLWLPFRSCKLAFWGHGESRRQEESKVSEWYKKKMIGWADWWFAYTRGTQDFLVNHGVALQKITNVQNSVDTKDLKQLVTSFSDAEKQSMRQHLGIAETAPVAIFCGRLDRVKGVAFLVEAARKVRAKIPDFHLIIVGGGLDQGAVQIAIEHDPWIHCVGPTFDRAKALLFSISGVFLLPGAVGLAILDAFAAGLPLITISLPVHGPEVEYLEQGRNGLMTPNDPQLYAEAVEKLLRDPEELQRLKDGALQSADKYSIENMADNFKEGILRCLGSSDGMTRFSGVT